MMSLLCCPFIRPLNNRNVKAFPASIELIKQLVGVLVWNQLRGVYYRVRFSECFPRTAVKLFRQCCQRPLSVP